MKKSFRVEFLEEVVDFLDKLDESTRTKIIYNIRKASIRIDPKLFKKVTSEIWEFRTYYNRKHYRLFAFWDKFHIEETVVIISHGILKKTRKIPKVEIRKAERIMKQYFKEKY